MARLPFVVQPKKNTEIVRLGNEEIGVIEMERKGYLSVAEKTFVDNVTSGSDGVSSMVLLANRVANKLKTSPEKAYTAIAEAMTGDTKNKLAATIAEDYGDDLAVITSRMADSMQRRSIAAATILLQTRVNSEWTIQDTMDLDPEMVQEISGLYDREEQREEVKPKSKQEEAEEVVGK